MTVGGFVAPFLTLLIGPDGASARGIGGGPVDCRRPSLAAAFLFVMLSLVSAAALVGGLWLTEYGTGTDGELGPAAFVASGFLFLATAIVPLGMARERRLEQQDNDRCDADYSDLEQALARPGAGARQEALKDLTLANFRQLRTFIAIAQRQARMSYYASLVGAGVSLLVLLAGAVIAIGASTGEGQIVTGSLTVIGTALSTFLSKTFLKTYDMSLRQLSYYAGQPLVRCHLLHAEWLALTAPDEFGPDAKVELWRQVIQASVDAGVNAQKHLLALHDCEPGQTADLSSLVVPRPRVSL